MEPTDKIIIPTLYYVSFPRNTKNYHRRFLGFDGDYPCFCQCVINARPFESRDLAFASVTYWKNKIDHDYLPGITNIEILRVSLTAEILETITPDPPEVVTLAKRLRELTVERDAVEKQLNVLKNSLLP